MKNKLLNDNVGSTYDSKKNFLEEFLASDKGIVLGVVAIWLITHFLPFEHAVYYIMVIGGFYLVASTDRAITAINTKIVDSSVKRRALEDKISSLESKVKYLEKRLNCSDD